MGKKKLKRLKKEHRMRTIPHTRIHEDRTKVIERKKKHRKKWQDKNEAE